MMVNQCILVQCVPTRFPPKMRWNSITIKLISAASYVMAAELMKFPWVPAFHWIFPLGPLTFWWPVNSAQRSRNSHCSRTKIWMSRQKVSVFFRGRAHCEWYLACGRGLKMWKQIISDRYSLVDGWRKDWPVRIVKESEISHLTLSAPQCSDWCKWHSW